MISRTAYGKLLHHHPVRKSLQPAFEQLYLPWLCPALCSPPPTAASHRSIATVSPASLGRPSRPSSSPKPGTVATVSTRHRPRGFAFAAERDPAAPHDDFIPFDTPAGRGDPWTIPWSSSRPRPGLSSSSSSSLPYFDPLAPLVIHDSLQPGARRFRKKYSVSGEVSEMHEMLDACLRVGRLERAAVVVRRLGEIYQAHASELLQAQNQYVEALVQRIGQTRDQKLLKHLQRWFEVEIRARGIAPDATTYALMMRAAFQEANQLKIDRTIRRYIALLEEAGLPLSATLDHLSQQDFGRVTGIAANLQLAFEVDEPGDEHGMEDELDPADNDEDVPAVRPKRQKGLGLKALQDSLSVFSDPSIIPYPDDMEGTAEEKKRAYDCMRQLRIEEDTWNSALERWRDEHSRFLMNGLGSALQLPSIGVLMWTWHEQLVPLIRDEIKKANAAELKDVKGPVDDERCLYGPFLQLISPEKISAITILQIIGKFGSSGVDRGTKITGLVYLIGRSVEQESNVELIKKENGPSLLRDNAQTQALDRYIAKTSGGFRSHASLRKLINKKIGNAVDTAPESTSSLPIRDWSSTTRVKVGAILVSLLLRVAKMDVSQEDPRTGLRVRETQPVFWKSHQFDKGHRVGVIRLNAHMGAKISKEPVGSAIAKHLPMLVEPMPWSGLRQGGFMHQTTNVVRLGPSQQQLKSYVIAAADSGDMAHVFAGLDVLGRTPWRVNRKVFDVMLEVWNSGEGLAKIPPENPRYEYPPVPASSDDSTTRRVYAHRMRQIENDRGSKHSERCFQNFQIEVARAYLNETFYFPHNVDFRGRAYPIAPYLNHMGADNCRGLLMFGKGKKLGRTGLKWLQVHLANVYGYDKASLSERRDFAMQHVDDICDSASRPLQGKKWWLQAEDPWQCLATCFELKNALDSPDPEEFVSYLPIHQDGTCNGLQHYAALGGDTIGAQQVNLEPGDRPADVYAAVADLVSVKVAADAAQGMKLAQLLEGKISRKVVKQTVMTNVYGVTVMGARAQVRSQLAGLYPSLFPKDDTVSIKRASAYIARHIFAALSSMFNGSNAIQRWLGECALRICSALTPEQLAWIEADRRGTVRPTKYAKEAINEKKFAGEQTQFKSSVIWTTPLRMPVVQPYRIATTRKVHTSLQYISLSQPTASDTISKRKQMQGFPPNFIHSLDASHMLLSALKCDELGLTFAAVHDSFWTHAADVDVMNGVLRDAFIKMHSEDIIGRLNAEFSARYQGCMYLASVKLYSPLGKKIQALRTSARKPGVSLARAKIDELLTERRRVRLLASEDPDQRAEGETMMTPGQLFAEVSDQKDLLSYEESDELESVGGLAASGECTAVGDEEDHDDPDELDDLPQPIRIGVETSSLDGIEPAEMLVETDTVEADTVKADTVEAMKAHKAAVAKRARKTAKQWLWLPLTFPPVPKKVRLSLPSDTVWLLAGRCD